MPYMMLKIWPSINMLDDLMAEIQGVSIGEVPRSDYRGRGVQTGINNLRLKRLLRFGVSLSERARRSICCRVSIPAKPLFLLPNLLRLEG